MSSYAYKVLKEVINGNISEEDGEKVLLDFFSNHWVESEPIMEIAKQSTQRDYLVKIYGKKCVFCNKTLYRYKTNLNKLRNEKCLTLEHILPISKGGPKHLDNLCVSCGKCNNDKMSNLIPAMNIYNTKKKTEEKIIDSPFSNLMNLMNASNKK